MIKVLIFLLFFPPSLGLLWQIIQVEDLSFKLIAIATILICLDQARMAVIDLDNINLGKKELQDSRLDRFYQITIITIIIELLGFYCTYFWLGWGAILILFSQVYFNSLVNIKIDTKPQFLIENKSIQDKILILLIDISAIIMVALWIFNIYSLTIAIILLSLVLIYEIIKYNSEVNKNGEIF